MDLESRDRRKRLGTKRLIHSFQYAWAGFLYTLKHEQNMLVHLLATIIIVIGGIIFKISFFEWLICFVLIGLVIGTELINTSIEAVVDLVSPTKNDLAKVAKDTAAAAVMVFSFIAAIVGIMIFLPKIMALW